MPQPDPYETWKERRAGLGPPADFTDRVMAGLRQTNPKREREKALARNATEGVPYAAGWWGVAGRIAIYSLACAVCLFRILQLVAPFLVAQSTL